MPYTLGNWSKWWILAGANEGQLSSDFPVGIQLTKSPWIVALGGLRALQIPGGRLAGRSGRMVGRMVRSVPNGCSTFLDLFDLRIFNFWRSK